MVYKSGLIFLPFCHNSRVWRTDGRTDRQTDGRTDRIPIARPRHLHSMQRDKNEPKLLASIIRCSVSNSCCWIRNRHWCTQSTYLARDYVSPGLSLSLRHKRRLSVTRTHVACISEPPLSMIRTSINPNGWYVQLNGLRPIQCTHKGMPRVMSRGMWANKWVPINIWQSCIKYSTSKYQYQYQYQWSKYQYKYQYLTFKYQYQYQYVTFKYQYQYEYCA